MTYAPQQRSARPPAARGGRGARMRDSRIRSTAKLVLDQADAPVAADVEQQRVLDGPAREVLRVHDPAPRVPALAPERETARRAGELDAEGLQLPHALRGLCDHAADDLRVREPGAATKRVASVAREAVLRVEDRRDAPLRPVGARVVRATLRQHQHVRAAIRAPECQHEAREPAPEHQHVRFHHAPCPSSASPSTAPPPATHSHSTSSTATRPRTADSGQRTASFAVRSTQRSLVVGEGQFLLRLARREPVVIAPPRGRCDLEPRLPCAGLDRGRVAGRRHDPHAGPGRHVPAPQRAHPLEAVSPGREHGPWRQRPGPLQPGCGILARIQPRHHDRAGALQRAQRLTQAPGRKQPPPPREVARVEQDDVHVPREGPVRQAVVHDQQLVSRPRGCARRLQLARCPRTRTPHRAPHGTSALRPRGPPVPDDTAGTPPPGRGRARARVGPVGA